MAWQEEQGQPIDPKVLESKPVDQEGNPIDPEDKPTGDEDETPRVLAG